MDTLPVTESRWETLTRELGREFAARERENDRDGTFVYENYEQLKHHRYFSALIPEELGGDGLSHAEVSHLIRLLGQHSGSTALAFSMHQHLIAASVWKYRHQGMGAPLLEQVAEHQLVLVSTGARDWLQSNGELEKVEGGYLFSGRKYFASQSAVGDVAVTSAPLRDPENGWQVLHFSVPLEADGVSLLNDWDVMGMRATGSQAIAFERVFVPDSAIALERPREGFHPVWNVVLTVALPLIMAAYVGVAEKALETALALGRKAGKRDGHTPFALGKLNNSLLAARSQWEAMLRLADNLDFQPDEGITSDMLSFKTNVAQAAMDAVGEAMEVVGGRSFYRKLELERLFRDVQAAQFHPLPRWEQYAFTGRRLMSEELAFQV